MDNHCNSNQLDHCTDLWCKDVACRCCHHIVLYFDCFVACVVSGLHFDNAKSQMYISEILKQCVCGGCFTGLFWKMLCLTNMCGTSSSSTLLWSGACLETWTKTLTLNHPVSMASSLVRHFREFHKNYMWLILYMIILTIGSWHHIKKN